MHDTPTREAIVTAAEGLLVAQGFAAMTFAQIAEHAGGSEPALRRRFDSTLEIADAVGARFAAAWSGIADSDVDPEDIATRLSALIAAGSQLAARHRGLVRALDAVPAGAFSSQMAAAAEVLGGEIAAWIHAAGDQVQVDAPHETASLIAALVRRMLTAGADVEWLERQLYRLLDLRPAPARGTPIEQLATPCLVLDRERLDRNLARMAGRARDLGVRLRPHIKTAKSVQVATRAAGAGGPLTVSTLREAEYFASRGFTDLVYAVAIVPDRLDRVAALTARGVRVALFVESVGVAEAVAAHPGRFEALIEVDSGENRTGVRVGADLIEIGRVLARAPRCALRGVATHGGHAYGARTRAERVAVAEQERAAAVSAAEALRRAGIPCPEVSVGSTPTAAHAAHLEGVTEMRPGVYTLGDLFQAGVGSHAIDDIACSVLATVLSHRRDTGQVVIDAGGLALSKDRSTAGWPFDAGYGLIADARTGTLIEGLRVQGVHQEHGMVGSATGEVPWQRLPVGGRVRVLPSHVCMTAAMYARYHVVQGGRFEEVWRRVNGW